MNIWSTFKKGFYFSVAEVVIGFILTFVGMGIAANIDIKNLGQLTLTAVIGIFAIFFIKGLLLEYINERVN